MTCSGLWPPAATPFRSDLSVDYGLLLEHCRTLLQEGADGLACLGTTSEANSLTLMERHAVIDALTEGGIAAERLLPGTGACAVGDAVALSRHATQTGCAGVLLLPPFFYKDVSDDGLFDYVAQVIKGVADDRLRIYLYHIPQMAGVAWSPDLISRLLKAFPGTVVGLKDSSGDWPSTKILIEAFPELAVFPASEAVLSEAIPLGAAGCISASANINTKGIASLLHALETGRQPDDLQAAATQVRVAATSQPLVPGIKAALAARYDVPDWCHVRPPLRRANAETGRALDRATHKAVEAP